MEKWMRKVWTIVQWTLAGVASAYIVMALYAFTITLLPLVVFGLGTQDWIWQSLVAGATGGFLAGLVKAGLAEVVDYWKG